MYAERGCVFYVGVLARGGAARYEVSVELGDAPVEVSSRSSHMRACTAAAHSKSITCCVTERAAVTQETVPVSSDAA